MLYDIFIYPIEFILKFLFESFYSVTDSYILSTILLSISVSIVLLPFYYWADRLQKRERDTLSKLNPTIDEFKSVYSGSKLHSVISTYYKQNKYHPIYSLRSLMGLLIQLPFFIAAYHFLSTYEPIIGVSSSLFKDLGAPDQWINIGGSFINAMPFIMTIINLITSFIFIKEMSKGEERQVWIMSLLFLVLLYNSPALLVFYWTMNHIFSFFRYFIEYKIKESKGEVEKGSLFKDNYFVKKSHIFIDFLRDVSLINILFLFILISIFLAFVIYFSIIGPNAYFAIHFLIVIGYSFLSFLIFIFFKGIVFKNIKKFSFNKFEMFKMSDLLLILLPLTAMVQYIITNNGVLSVSGSLFIFSIPLSVYFLTIIILPSFFSFFGNRILYMSVSLSMFTILSFMPLLSSYFGWYLLPDFLIQFSLFLFIVIFIYYFYKNYENILKLLILIFFISNSIFIYYSFSQKSSNLLLAGKDDNNQTENITDLASLNKELLRSSKIKVIDDIKNKQLSIKPDIYLLIYDAYPNEKTMKSLGVDNLNQFNFLKNNGFKIYKDSYSVGPASLESLSTALNMSDKVPDVSTARYLVTQDNNVYSILREQGYTLGIVFEADFMFGKYKPSLDVIYPTFLDRAHFVLWKSILMGVFTSVSFDMDYEEFKTNKKLFIDSLSDKPKFLYTHTGPYHSLLGVQCADDEKEQFETRLKKANIAMKEDVNNIIKNNPDAIIIVAGDHGAYITGNCLMMNSYDSKENITRLNIQDTFGAFLSIRWPKTIKSIDRNITIVQDIFPIIFSSILKDESIFKDLKVKSKTRDANNAVDSIYVEDGIIHGGNNDGEPLFNAI